MKAKIILTPERCQLFIESRRKYMRMLERYFQDERVTTVSSECFESRYVILGVDLNPKGIGISISVDEK